jgi:hypothetical protein
LECKATSAVIADSAPVNALGTMCEHAFIWSNCAWQVCASCNNNNNVSCPTEAPICNLVDGKCRLQPQYLGLAVY